MLVPMNSDAGISKVPAGMPLPDLELLITALGHSTRWRMLKELTCGEARTIDEMAKVGGTSYDNASKHLATLLRAGLIVRGRGRLYSMARQYLPAPGRPVVDCGHCLLRLDAAGH